VLPGVYGAVIEWRLAEEIGGTEIHDPLLLQAPYISYGDAKD